MCRRTVKAVLRLGLVAVVMAMVPQGAEAGCKNLPPYLCASWIKGTLFCDNLLRGVAAHLAKNCDPAQPATCPLVTECTVFGTIGAGCDVPTDPPNPTASCEIKGNLRCLNPNGHFNDKGTAFIAGPISEAAGSTTCTKGGKCVNEAEVQPVNDGLCPGPSQTGGSGNWTLDFTPDEFKGRVCVCPGGFDNLGTCCADAKRSNGSCSKVYGDGTPGCVTEFCTIAPNAPKGTQYTCNVIE